MGDIRKEIRDSFAGLSRDKIFEKLLNAGFHVKKGTGKINIKEDDDHVEFQYTFI